MFVRSQQPAFIVSSSLPLANSLNYSSRFQKCPTTSIKRTASAYMCCQSSPNRSAHLPDANQFISISPSSCDLAHVEESANFDQELDTSGPTSGNINNNNNNNNSNNNNNNNNNNDNNNDDDKERANILSKYGKTESDLQQNIRAIKTDELNAYLKATASGLSSIFAKFWPGWRVRVAADPEFPFKLLMEQTVGLGLTVSGMIAARGKNILNELDFAICDTVVGATMNFVLVYLLTPALGAASSGGMFATLPANLFVYGNYSLLARLGGFFYKSALFSACGFAASMIGTGISQGLVKLKRRNNKNNNHVTNIHQPELPNIFVNSAAWAGFMFVSSSPRYQTVAGLERLMFSCAPESVAKLGSALVRTGNNVLGGATWVIWAKAIGLQKSDDDNKKSE